MTAAAHTDIRGVSFAPTAAVPKPLSCALTLGGLGVVRLKATRRKQHQYFFSDKLLLQSGYRVCQNKVGGSHQCKSRSRLSSALA